MSQEEKDSMVTLTVFIVGAIAILLLIAEKI